MEEKLDQLNKNVEDLTEIVVSMKDYMEKNLVTKDELKEEIDRLATKIELVGVEERVISKIDGLQRSVDASYERHTDLETRVTKVETALHL